MNITRLAGVDWVAPSDGKIHVLGNRGETLPADTPNAFPVLSGAQVFYGPPPPSRRLGEGKRVGGLSYPILRIDGTTKFVERPAKGYQVHFIANEGHESAESRRAQVASAGHSLPALTQKEIAGWDGIDLRLSRLPTVGGSHTYDVAHKHVNTMQSEQPWGLDLGPVHLSLTRTQGEALEAALELREVSYTRRGTSADDARAIARAIIRRMRYPAAYEALALSQLDGSQVIRPTNGWVFVVPCLATSHAPGRLPTINADPNSNEHDLSDQVQVMDPVTNETVRLVHSAYDPWANVGL